MEKCICRGGGTHCKRYCYGGSKGQALVCRPDERACKKRRVAITKRSKTKIR
jgi:hypothetical protein